MRPLDLRSVNWLPGMLVRHQQFDAIADHTIALATWVLRHTARYGVVQPPGSTVPPVEVEYRIERDSLVVRVTRCLALTPGGGIVDIQPETLNDPRLVPEARREIDPSADATRIPVILECLGRDGALLLGEPEADGRVPWRVPGYRVHLDSRQVGNPDWALQIAELAVGGGRVTPAPDFFPATLWVENLSGLVKSLTELQKQVDRIRDLLVSHLRAYPPGLRTESREYPILRQIVADILGRLAALDAVGRAARQFTPPEELFAAYMVFLDGVRTVIECNAPLLEAIRLHYAERQPPLHPRAPDFMRELASVRSWHFDPAALGESLRRISDLTDQLLIALDEPVQRMLGPGGGPVVDDSEKILYRGKYYSKLAASVTFDEDAMEIAGFPTTVINQVVIKFPSGNLSTGKTYGVRFAADFRSYFDLKDGVFDQEAGYGFAFFQVSRVVHRSLRVEFDPRDPLKLLASASAELNRLWWVGWV